MERIARLCKALAEPVRLRILLLLLGGERCVCDLVAVLGLPQSTISRHLAYLRNAGWVQGERRGVWMHYRLAPAADPFRQAFLHALAAELPRTGTGAADLRRLGSWLQQKEKTTGHQDPP